MSIATIFNKIARLYNRVFMAFLTLAILSLLISAGFAAEEGFDFFGTQGISILSLWSL